MATRNLIMVVDRKHSSKYPEGFAVHPDLVSNKSYVNMYMHHDGYPEWQGVQLANWMKVNSRQDGSAVAAKLVHDHYYDSCYLYNHPDNIDHQYTYIIFYGDEPLIFCYDVWTSREVFCYTPNEIISKYVSKDDPMEYTDFAKGQTRLYNSKSDDVKYHSNKLLELLQKL